MTVNCTCIFCDYYTNTVKGGGCKCTRMGANEMGCVIKCKMSRGGGGGNSFSRGGKCPDVTKY